MEAEDVRRFERERDAIHARRANRRTGRRRSDDDDDENEDAESGSEEEEVRPPRSAFEFYAEAHAKVYLDSLPEGEDVDPASFAHDLTERYGRLATTRAYDEMEAEDQRRFERESDARNARRANRGEERERRSDDDKGGDGEGEDAGRGSPVILGRRTNSSRTP